MNVAIFVTSLRYIRQHKSICKLASWVYNELRSNCYTDDKLRRSLCKSDADVVENIIDLITDNFKRTSKWFDRMIISDRIVMLLTENGFKITITQLNRFIQRSLRSENRQFASYLIDKVRMNLLQKSHN